jgi:hypothetical protein
MEVFRLYRRSLTRDHRPRWRPLHLQHLTLRWHISLAAVIPSCTMVRGRRDERSRPAQLLEQNQSSIVERGRVALRAVAEESSVTNKDLFVNVARRATANVFTQTRQLRRRSDQGTHRQHHNKLARYRQQGTGMTTKTSRQDSRLYRMRRNRNTIPT